MSGEVPEVDLSVLTPSYGYARFLKDSILSVTGQTGISIEHVVQDGGSKDGTIEMLAGFDSVNWVSEPDEGQSDALNKALRRSRGRWIGWLNADEFYLPGGLGELVRKGDQSGADAVYADGVFVDERGAFDRLLVQHDFNETVLRTYGVFMFSSSIIFRRSTLPEDPWDPALKRVMDWDMYLRVASMSGRFAYLRRPVGAFRLHGEQVTAQPGTGETLRVRERYGISKSRRGRWLHAALKATSGAVVKEVKARSLRGRSLRWFADAPGLTTWETLMARCYGRPGAGQP